MPIMLCNQCGSTEFMFVEHDETDGVDVYECRHCGELFDVWEVNLSLREILGAKVQ
jgi:transcription elongation factor Elf1